MSFETSKRRIVKSERHPRPISVQWDQPASAESELASGPYPENTLDLDSLERLRGLFELLDKWDQQEKTDGK
jgi:hypothetical protein